MRTSEGLSLLLENYLHTVRGEEPPLFTKAKQFSREFQKDGISLSRTESEIVCFMIKLMRLKKFVEVGTLTGYSALWILQGLGEDGELWTFEKDPQHAAKAREVLDEAVAARESKNQRFHLIEGDAEENLQKISAQGPFDGIFIDGNKAAYGRYLEWARQNIRSGGLVVCDNVFLSGAVLRETSDRASRFSSKQVSVMDKVNHDLLLGPDFTGIIVPTAEGMAIAVRT